MAKKQENGINACYKGAALETRWPFPPPNMSCFVFFPTLFSMYNSPLPPAALATANKNTICYGFYIVLKQNFPFPSTPPMLPLLPKTSSAADQYKAYSTDLFCPHHIATSVILNQPCKVGQSYSHSTDEGLKQRMIHQLLHVSNCMSDLTCEPGTARLQPLFLGTALHLSMFPFP